MATIEEMAEAVKKVYSDAAVGKIINAPLYMIQRKSLQPLGPGLSGWVDSIDEAWADAYAKLPPAETPSAPQPKEQLGTCADFPTTLHAKGSCENCDMWSPCAPQEGKSEPTEGFSIERGTCDVDSNIHVREVNCRGWKPAGKPQDEPNPMYELCAGCSHKHGHHAYDVHGKASCFQGCGCNRFETSGRYWEPCEPQDEPKRPEPAPSPHAAVDAILTQIARAKARVRELESAINWVCGCGDSGFDPEENLERGAYWWRTPLVKRARMIYNGNKYVAEANHD